MNVNDFIQQVAINNELTRQTLDLLSDGQIDWSGPMNLRDTLTTLRAELLTDGVSRNDIMRLKSLQPLSKSTELLDERTYPAERTFSGLHRVTIVIDNLLTLL